MILLLNTTKTMDLTALVPAHLKVTKPQQMEMTSTLADRISKMSSSQLKKLMSLSAKLATETRDNAALWGLKNQPRIPSLFAFTGLLYKNIDAHSLEIDQLKDAQKKIRILSGLYGLLRPLDVIEAYRLEMGHKLTVGKAKNIAVFWKEILTTRLNEDLESGESIISVAAQEYIKALDLKKLKCPMISPVFKEQHADGTFKNVVVHSKKARGALVRYALVNRAQTPQDLMEFNSMGWKATQKPPMAGTWLFTRPVTS
jgi:uncharacterized protein